MRTLIGFVLFGFLSATGLLSARGSDLGQLLIDIEGKWQGKVVRDQADPNRPVIEIIFHCTSHVPDELIEQLVAFPQLRRLGLVGGQHLTNKGLPWIANLTNLESLELRNRKLTADGLKHLARLPSLRFLFLWGVDLNKENGGALEGLKSLEILDLREVMVSTEGLESLKKLPRLKQIDGFHCNGVFQSEDEVRKALPDIKLNLRK